jgi:hypothetical protein
MNTYTLRIRDCYNDENLDQILIATQSQLDRSEFVSESGVTFAVIQTEETEEIVFNSHPNIDMISEGDFLRGWVDAEYLDLSIEISHEFDDQEDDGFDPEEDFGDIQWVG